MNGYIFRCSERTLQECLDKSLFGASDGFKSFIDQVKVGVPLFLYDLTRKILIGEFVANSEGAINIDPNAWKNARQDFPYQVKVKSLGELKQLDRLKIENFIKFQGKYPAYLLTRDQVITLKNLFENANQFEDSEKSFYRRFSHDQKSKDGHMFQSKSEVKIDNWLFDQRIPHIAGPNLPGYDDLKTDWIILGPNNEKVYIEFWGMDHEEYIKEKEKKLEIYKEQVLSLIGLEPEDLSNLDMVLLGKIRTILKLK